MPKRFCASPEKLCRFDSGPLGVHLQGLRTCSPDKGTPTKRVGGKCESLEISADGLSGDTLKSRRWMKIRLMYSLKLDGKT